MLKTIHTICTYLIIGLGVLHLLFTFHDYDAFTLRALWFASAGFAIMFAGFLNLILSRLARKETLVRTLCVIANVICASLFGAALWLMQQPQVFIGVLLFTVATIAALAAPQQSARN
jgi:MFS-type transporter involved in bile tolerance (Atg22 family)